MASNFFLCLVSCLQLLIVKSELGDYCVNQFEVLSLEEKWIESLIVLQISKVIISCVWQTPSLNTWDNDEYDSPKKNSKQNPAFNKRWSRQDEET